MTDLHPTVAGPTEPAMAPTAPATAVLEVEEVSLAFGGIQALRSVDFDVREGELLAVIGPNGAGKTSILNCINGVYRPQRGSIRLHGTELVGSSPPETVDAGVARTFQNLGLFTNLSVMDNLMLGRHHLMRSGALSGAVWLGRARRETVEHRRRCAEIIDFLDLIPYRNLPAGMLPYGVQKRIELGRALAMEPTLLMLDEPVAGMNLEETEDMARHLIEIRQSVDCATVVIEHQLDFVMDLADRVLVLDFGEVAAIGTPTEIQSDPRVVEAYLGGLDEEIDLR
ncbi:MAG TPA: ABC transporter ATP-binding protein [Acidimicrobiales bacterium]|nr:ABC transporter ATP-binding protein [Acidimicrobiales bacterium]